MSLDNFKKATWDIYYHIIELNGNDIAREKLLPQKKNEKEYINDLFTNLKATDKIEHINPKITSKFITKYNYSYYLNLIDEPPLDLLLLTILSLTTNYNTLIIDFFKNIKIIKNIFKKISITDYNIITNNLFSHTIDDETYINLNIFNIIYTNITTSSDINYADDIKKFLNKNDNIILIKKILGFPITYNEESNIITIDDNLNKNILYFIHIIFYLYYIFYTENPSANYTTYNIKNRKSDFTANMKIIKIIANTFTYSKIHNLNLLDDIDIDDIDIDDIKNNIDDSIINNDNIKILTSLIKIYKESNIIDDNINEIDFEKYTTYINNKENINYLIINKNKDIINIFKEYHELERDFNIDNNGFELKEIDYETIYFNNEVYKLQGLINNYDTYVKMNNTEKSVAAADGAGPPGAVAGPPGAVAGPPGAVASPPDAVADGAADGDGPPGAVADGAADGAAVDAGAGAGAVVAADGAAVDAGAGAVAGGAADGAAVDAGAGIVSGDSGGPLAADGALGVPPGEPKPAAGASSIKNDYKNSKLLLYKKLEPLSINEADINKQIKDINKQIKDINKQIKDIIEDTKKLLTEEDRTKLNINCENIKLNWNANSCYIDSLFVALFSAKHKYMDDILYNLDVNNKLTIKNIYNYSNIEYIYNYNIIIDENVKNKLYYLRSLIKKELIYLYNKISMKESFNDSTYNLDKLRDYINNYITTHKNISNAKYSDLIISNRENTQVIDNSNIIYTIIANSIQLNTEDNTVTINKINNKDYSVLGNRFNDPNELYPILHQIFNDTLYKNNVICVYTYDNEDNIQDFMDENNNMKEPDYDKLIVQYTKEYPFLDIITKLPSIFIHINYKTELFTNKILNPLVNLTHNNLTLQSIIVYVDNNKHYICVFKCENMWYKYNDMNSPKVVKLTLNVYNNYITNIHNSIDNYCGIVSLYYIAE